MAGLLTLLLSPIILTTICLEFTSLPPSYWSLIALRSQHAFTDDVYVTTLESAYTPLPANRESCKAM